MIVWKLHESLPEITLLEIISRCFGFCWPPGYHFDLYVQLSLGQMSIFRSFFIYLLCFVLSSFVLKVNNVGDILGNFPKVNFDCNHLMRCPASIFVVQSYQIKVIIKKTPIKSIRASLHSIHNLFFFFFFFIFSHNLSNFTVAL